MKKKIEKNQKFSETIQKYAKLTNLPIPYTKIKKKKSKSKKLKTKQKMQTTMKQSKQINIILHFSNLEKLQHKIWLAK